MSITFKFEVVSVDETSRCMEVIYTSDGNETLRISTRLPYVNEAVEDVIRMYAPLQHWEENKKQMVAPVVGLSGELAPIVVGAPIAIAQDIIVNADALSVE